MVLFVKKFDKFLKRCGFNKSGERKKTSGKSRARHSTRTCYECGEPGQLIVDCPNKKNKDECEKKGYNKENHRKGYKIQTHLGQEWDSNTSDTDSDEEECVTTIALAISPPNKSLFEDSSDDEPPICLMVKGRKVSLPTELSNVDLTSEYDSDSDNDLIDNVDKLSLPSMCDLLETIEGQEKTLKK
ncbi:uncharacterized protein LOC133896999 [Phragmites australis]|uniref:uncharacterized protein LOC133896999 n=1 Tax=Phragmites australis TaxID=29695 RepID=UPI002D79AB44|nr:uncharacterized protein LOC133896999 [Phragmites australis]